MGEEPSQSSVKGGPGGGGADGAAGELYRKHVRQDQV